MKRLGRRQDRIDATAVTNEVRDNLRDIAQSEAQLLAAAGRTPWSGGDHTTLPAGAGDYLITRGAEAGQVWTRASNGAAAYRNTGLESEGPAATAARAAADYYRDNQIIIPRHRFVGPLLRRAKLGGSPSSVFRGWALGNSIMQGTGTTSAVYAIPYILATRLRAYTNVLTTNDWTPNNLGVGGSLSTTALGYASDDVSGGRTVRGVLGSRPYLLVMDLRNDVSNLSVQASAQQLRLLCQIAKRRGQDVFIIIDPPRIDTTTGAILDTQANFGDWADEWRRVAADEGASLVDPHKMMSLMAAGGTDLRPYYPSNDGVHPENAGHSLIGNLLADCVLAAPVGLTATFGRAPGADTISSAVSVFTSIGGVTAPSAVSSLSTAGTVRMSHTGEGAAQAFILGSGQNAQFNSPIPARAVIVHVLTGPGYGGTFRCDYGYVQVGGGNFTVPGSGAVREYGILINMPVGNAFADGTITMCQIGNVSGTVAVLGVTFIGATGAGYSDGVWPHATETGTWGAATITGGRAARSSATVGDTLDLIWYGTDLNLYYERSPSQGEFTYSTDGGTATTTTNGYLNAAAFAQPLQAARGLPEGWHTTRIAVAPKNAASSANTVKIGAVSTYLTAPDPRTLTLPVAVGQTVQLPESWERATVERVLTGAPYVDRWVSGQSTLTLSGTGSALVRLER